MTICPWLALLGRMRPQDSLDLLEVIDVVAGQHAHVMLDGFLATLGVHAVVLPLLRREGFEQREIGFAQHAKLLDTLTRVAFLVVPGHYPGVLVKGLDGRS